MNYEVIKDEKILKEFIESLPELSEDEVFYCCLFARSKYLTEEQKGQITHIKSDKAQLKRFTANKHTLLSKIKQLECPIGSYVQYKKNVPSNPVPQETLALYITINPRSLSLATRNSLKKFVEMVADNPTHSFNPSNFSTSEIQRSKAKNAPWFIIDIDSKDFDVEDLKTAIKGYIGKTPFKLLETRGGYHILISLREIDDSVRKTWYNNLKEELGEDVDQTGDIMIPIPGSSQGGWMPKFV